MLVVGIVISAVSIFLGVFTKFPQGGGGLINNLMALTFFLPAPPLPRLALQKRMLFDLETAIAENQLFYLSNPVVTRNGTYGPMPGFPQKPRSAADGRNASASNATFAFPTFSFPAFSPPEELTEFWKSIGITIMVFMALCLPWLVTKVINLLEKTRPALPAASKPMFTGFEERVAQIEPISPLLQDLRIIISERDRAFTDLQSSIKEAREAKKQASEKDAEKEEAIEGMHFELNRALTELQKEKKMVAKLEEEKEKKIDELRDEMSSQMKAWEDKAAKLAEEAKRAVDGFRAETSREIITLAEKVAILEEEKKREADGLREESSNQMNAWMDSNKKWEEERAEEDERHNEAINSLKMGQEQEIESWRKQVENLKNAMKVAEEASVAKLVKILERMEKEKEGLEIEKEAWKEEKKEMTKEKKEVEEKREERRKFWAEGSDRAQRQINQLVAETQTLKEKVADGQKKVAEAEEARETAEAKNKRGQVEAEKVAKESIANWSSRSSMGESSSTTSRLISGGTANYYSNSEHNICGKPTSLLPAT